MKYLNKTPEEIVRRYRRGLRWKQGLILLILLAYIVSICWGIWSFDSGLPTVLFAYALLIILTWPLSVWIALDFLSLNRILNENCDPVTYTAVCRLLRGTHRMRRNRLTRAVNEAVGLHWCGRFSESMAMADGLTIPERDVSHQLLVRNLRFNCFVLSKDLDSARRVREETARYAASIRKPAMQKRGAELVKLMDSGLALREGDFETFRRLEKELSVLYRVNIQKVTSAFRLAEADLAQGETQNAKARLELVVKMGGTIYLVERARSMLAEME